MIIPQIVGMKADSDALPARMQHMSLALLAVLL